MNNFKIFKQGAEGRLYKGTYLNKPCIIKERFVKKYRHPELDTHLTKERIKAESKAIVKCRSLDIHTPSLYLVDFKRRMIFMEYYEHSITAKDYINKASDDCIKLLARNIGTVVAKMHSNNIIHGDLTTSNILLVNMCGVDDYFSNYDDLKLVLIDFGLAHTDSTSEDKGVDLYVLERALISTHLVADKIIPLILDAYRKCYKNCKDVLSKYEEVRARGRKRTMVG